MRADALLRLAKLESIMLELPARVRLGYGFAEGGDWDDAVLTVELRTGTSPTAACPADTRWWA